MKVLFKYLPATITAIVWGSTFVASKSILEKGVSATTLMTFRFLIAYIILRCICRRKLEFHFNKQELLFLLLGISGGSVYFIFEYLSLKYTSAVNVGLICALVPVISTFISYVLKQIKINLFYIIGSVLAFFGVFVVVTNGELHYSINVFGDMIAFVAAVLWAIYTIILKLLDGKVEPLIVSRRLFFYALITIIPFTIFNSNVDEWKLFTNIDIALPSLYLSVMASAVCIWLWNVSINNIGLVRTNNFLYSLPVVTLFSSAIFFADEIILSTVIGTIFIFVGIIIADVRRN